jgi:hypothetical protein
MHGREQSGQPEIVIAMQMRNKDVINPSELQAKSSEL